MANRMTPEQVAGLRLPEGCKMLQDGCGEWWWNWTDDRALRTDTIRGVMSLAVYVANGWLPRSVYDWALAAYDGRTVPTVEQWEAARTMARTAHCIVGSRLADLRDIISPPKPQPAPTPQAETPPDPRPVVDVFAGSRLRLPVVQQAAKVCGECRHYKRLPYDTIKRCAVVGGCKVGDGTWETTLRAPSPTRDASKCERWER